MTGGSNRRCGRSSFRSTRFTEVRPRPTRKSWGRFMALEILKPGLSTTVQDLGRPGYYHLGIPESGAMDKFSLAAANLLVGNLEGAAQPGWASFVVKSGQTLSFGFLKSGARAYIAVRGGVDVPLVLGSRSTYPLGALGGFEGRALKAGDRVKVGSQSGDTKPSGGVPPRMGAEVSETTGLRVLPA